MTNETRSGTNRGLQTMAKAAVFWLAITAACPAAPLTIVITNLPGSGNTAVGQTVACVGTINNWNNGSSIATITPEGLTFTFPDAAVAPLGSGWGDVPPGANAAFQFVKPGTWEPVVRADFLSNEGNFRVTLLPGSPNTVEIDAGSAPMLVDQSASARVNGAVESPVVPIDRQAFAFPGGRWKALVMSFDDGHIQDRDLVSIFNSHGIKGTFHINSGSLSTWTFLTSGELATVFSGHEISSHTVNHPHLNEIDDAGIQWQVTQDRGTLAIHAGYTMRSMAYPFGDYDKRVLSILAQSGVPCARTVVPTFKLNHLPTHPLKWHPTCHHTAGQGMADELNAWSAEEMALLFIWGHSWELDNNYADNSWSYMTALCRNLGDRGDTWYASMGDVHEYLQAIRALEHPAPATVFNPSSGITVWAKLDGVMSRIRPGHRVTHPPGTVQAVQDLRETGGTVSIRYEPGANALGRSGSIRLHIGQDGWQDTEDVLMTPGAAGVWTATYPVSPSVRRVNFAFLGDTGTVDDHGGDDWTLAVYPEAAGTPAPARIVPGSPVVSLRPANSQNRIGDTFDFSTEGGSLGSVDEGGFGDLGRVHFNYDAQNLYIGAHGCRTAGNNNAMVIFLSFDNMLGGVTNLWGFRGTPFGLDKMHNVAFTHPVHVAIVLGDEFGDGTFPHFNLGSGYDFGQGIFRLSSGEKFFTPLPGARLSQFEGLENIPTFTADDDGNRLTDRWEAAIPWASLNAALGMSSVGTIRVAGVIASEAVQGHDRYLSSNHIGESAMGTKDAYGNWGFNFVTLTGARLGLPHPVSDGNSAQTFQDWIAGQGMEDGEAHPAADPDGDGWSNAQEFAFGLDPKLPDTRFPVTVTGGSGRKVLYLQRQGVTYQVRASENADTPFSTIVTPTVSANQEDLPSAAFTRYEAVLPASWPRGFVKIDTLVP